MASSSRGTTWEPVSFTLPRPCLSRDADMSDLVEVAIVAHRFGGAHPTGVDRYARELVCALDDRDDVGLRLCAPAEPATVDRPDWIPPDVDLRRIRGPRRMVLAGWWTVGLPRLDPVCGDVDLVHVTLPLFPCPTTRPLVYTVHDLFPIQHPNWYNRRDRFGFGRAMRDLDRAAAVIAVSDRTATALRDLELVDPARVSVIPEGVSSRFFDIPDHQEVVATCRRFGLDVGGYDVFVGQASRRKNVSVLIEAMASVDHPTPLVIAGPPGDATEDLVLQAERLGVGSLLRPVGFLGDEELHHVLHGARALLHPCPEEGFGLTPLEAMASGTAAVVARSGALIETAGDGAFQCDPDDPSAWASAMDDLADTSNVEALVARGRTWVRRYDWEAVARQTNAVYRAALDRAYGA